MVYCFLNTFISVTVNMSEVHSTHFASVREITVIFFVKWAMLNFYQVRAESGFDVIPMSCGHFISSQRGFCLRDDTAQIYDTINIQLSVNTDDRSLGEYKLP